MAITVASLLLLIIIVLAAIFIGHDRYGFYPSGGKLSDLQLQYDAVFYDLHLEILSDKQALKGFANITVKSLNDSLRTIELDYIQNFDVSRISFEDKILPFEHRKQKLVIDLPEIIPQGQLVRLAIHYSGQPIQALYPPWIGGFNWSKDTNGNDWIGISCQGEGGKIWYPCKTHPSDKADSVALHITVPEPYYCAANGVLQEITKPSPGRLTYHWLTRYPISTYNVNINIGKYNIIEKSYTSVNGNIIPVIYYHLTAPESKADSLVNMAIGMLQTFEKFYGEYPFGREKFGLVETAYLGMEHQTINAYGNEYRYKETLGHSYDLLMLHEMTHEWWGNKITANDWADFWIHEGIGTYSEALYLLEKTGEVGYHAHMATIQSRVRNKRPILVERPAKSHETYSGDIYYKGACFMHALRYALGDNLFFPLLNQFSTDSRYTYQHGAITDDFLALVNERSGSDFSPFFHLFLETTTLPNVMVDSLGQGQWSVVIPNIEFALPVELEMDGKLCRIVLSKKPLMVQAELRPVVDPRNWYLLQGNLTDRNQSQRPGRYYSDS